ncbi:MAG: enoyl-CoA hydratase-related protein [Pseudomonadota bacterium]
MRQLIFCGVLETLYNPLIRKLVNARFPVVVALNGVAAGGAAGLVLAADFVIAAEDAKLISAFSKIGLIPDCGVSWAAVRKLGYARAMSFSLLERTIEAREGAALGLFCDVVPPVELRQRAIALSKDLAAASATSASLTKAALNAALCAPLDTQLETEKNLQGDAFGASDFLEGVKAFYEKRSPKF